MTPEQIKHREFPVRLKGYDPDEVRRFLDQVAAVFRVAVADEGGQAPTGDSDLAKVLAAAHEAAEKIVLDAERQAAALVAKAEDKHARADEHAARAKQILERAQERYATISADCNEAKQTLADAESRAADIVAAAQEDASKVVLTERAEQAAIDIEARVEAETRARLDEVDAAVDAKLAELDTYVADTRRSAEEEATRLIAEAKARVDELADRERTLQRRVAEAQTELRSLVARFVGEEPTIDLTAADPVIAFEGTYHDGLDEDLLDDDLFPDLHDDEAPASDVRLEWNKPEWARANGIAVS
jgi:DivIVA domain-containing protein